MIKADTTNSGATLIDVGINRVTTQSEFDRIFTPDQPDYAKRKEQFAAKGSTLVGDIHPSAFLHASAYTPVPGGIGPLTIAMLMSNTVKAAKLRRGI
jgi:methylenetetrahydrofolate dehydrogenase (NADP+)/methenyltetrahydrofolate cyclohydrolase